MPDYTINPAVVTDSPPAQDLLKDGDHLFYLDGQNLIEVIKVNGILFEEQIGRQISTGTAGTTPQNVEISGDIGQVLPSTDGNSEDRLLVWDESAGQVKWTEPGDYLSFDSSAELDVDASAAYQPLDSDLTTLAGLSNSDSEFIVGSGSTWTVESGSTARDSLDLGVGDAVQFEKLIIQGDDVTDSIVVKGPNNVANGTFDTTITFTPQTVNRTLTIPDATGTVLLSTHAAFTSDVTVAGEIAGNDTTFYAWQSQYDVLQVADGMSIASDTGIKGIWWNTYDTGTKKYAEGAGKYGARTYFSPGDGSLYHQATTATGNADATATLATVFTLTKDGAATFAGSVAAASATLTTPIAVIYGGTGVDDTEDWAVMAGVTTDSDAEFQSVKLTGDQTSTGQSYYIKLGPDSPGTVSAMNYIINCSSRPVGTAGDKLVIEAGGSVAGSTNTNGGNLVLSSGGGDGTGTSEIQFYVKQTGGDSPVNAITMYKSSTTKSNIEFQGSAGGYIGSSTQPTALSIADDGSITTLGDFTVGGTLVTGATRSYLNFGFKHSGSGVSGAATTEMKTVNGVTNGSGYRTIRSGSVTGISVQCENDHGAEFNVHVGGLKSETLTLSSSEQYGSLVFTSAVAFTDDNIKVLMVTIGTPSVNVIDKIAVLVEITT